MRINVNTLVKFEVSEEGREQWTKFWRDVFNRSQVENKPTVPTIPEQMSLWELMMVFGPALSHAGPAMFVANELDIPGGMPADLVEEIGSFVAYTTVPERTSHDDYGPWHERLKKRAASLAAKLSAVKQADSLSNADKELLTFLTDNKLAEEMRKPITITSKPIQIPECCVDYLTRVHPNWYATIDKPDVEVGDNVTFFTADGKTFIHGEVVKLIGPGTRFKGHTDTEDVSEDFTGWWKIVFEPEKPVYGPGAVQDAMASGYVPAEYRHEHPEEFQTPTQPLAGEAIGHGGRPDFPLTGEATDPRVKGAPTHGGSGW